jgi:hypothetical protein
MSTINSTSDSAAAYPTGHAIGSPTQAYSQAKTSSSSSTYATAQEAAAAAYAAYAARTSAANTAGASQQQHHQQQQQQQPAASNSMQYNAGGSSSSASNTAACIVGKALSDPTSTGLNLPVLPPVSSDDVVAAMAALGAVHGDYWALQPHHALVLTKALVNEALESPGVKGRVRGLIYIKKNMLECVF